MTKRNNFILLPALIGSFFTATACVSEEGKTDEEAVGKKAIDFAEAYYNQRYEKAMELTTPESRKWITFWVSNLTEDDLAVLSQYPEASKATLGEVSITSDTTATAGLTIDKAFVADSLGQAGHMEDNKTLRLHLVKRDKKWFVCFGQ